MSEFQVTYVDSPWTRPPTELTVNTDPAMNPHDRVSFQARDETASAYVELDAVAVRRLYAQLGEWLAHAD